MKSFGTVRIESLRFENFKNIGHGEMNFPEAKKLERGIYDEDSFKNVIGVYGQNGSGKTSCIQALRVLQHLLSGVNLNNRFRNFIMINKESMSVGADFLVSIDDDHYFVNYDVEISKYNDGLKISKEKISYHDLNDNNKKHNVYSFEEPNLINQTFANLFNSNGFEVYKMIAGLETKGNANQFSTISSVFNGKLLSVLEMDQFKDKVYLKILKELSFFGRFRLAIYEINYFNEIEKVGINFRCKDESKESLPVVNDIFVTFDQTSLKIEHYNSFVETIDKINKVLPSIIKGLQVSIVDVIKTKRSAANITNDVVNFRLVSKNNGKTVPLFSESNGTKKVISILSGLIDVYNHEGCFMAVDEFDSGIFEYLLGELAYAFDNFASGQLLFTSHNLRILEKVNYKSLFFTTIDEKEKFIQISSVRDSNNMRNLYYKYLLNGFDGKRTLYNDIKTSDLISAFDEGADQ